MDVSLRSTPKNKLESSGSRFIFSNLTTNGNDIGNSSMDESGIISAKNLRDKKQIKVITPIFKVESN